MTSHTYYFTTTINFYTYIQPKKKMFLDLVVVVVVLGFNATLTAKVVSEVGEACVSWLSYTSSNTNFSFQSH